MMPTTCVYCPVCQKWQIDYDPAVLATYMDLVWVDGVPMPDIKAAFGRVDEIVRDHMNACMEALWQTA